jgi:hypothetical protein
MIQATCSRPGWLRWRARMAWFTYTAYGLLVSDGAFYFGNSTKECRLAEEMSKMFATRSKSYVHPYYGQARRSKITLLNPSCQYEHKRLWKFPPTGLFAPFSIWDSPVIPLRDWYLFVLSVGSDRKFIAAKTQMQWRSTAQRHLAHRLTKDSFGPCPKEPRGGGLICWSGNLPAVMLISGYLRSFLKA